MRSLSGKALYNADTLYYAVYVIHDGFNKSSSEWIQTRKPFYTSFNISPHEIHDFSKVKHSKCMSFTAE